MDHESESAAVTKRPPPKRPRSFGELDLESIGADLPLVSSEETPSSAPVTKKKGAGAITTPVVARRPSIQTRTTRQGMEAVTRLAEEETRIARAGALDHIIDQSRRPTMALDEATAAALVEIDGGSRGTDSRRSLNSLDSLDSLDDVFDAFDAPPDSHGSRGSGVASSRGDRVAEMRELYARGDAVGALAVASEVAEGLTGAEPEPFDGSDPYGGLIPVDDGYDGFGGLEPVYDDAIDSTAIVDASDAAADSARLRRMTSRQVPRLLVTSKEISKLPMDPRAAFLLGNIDGVQSMEEILDICAMPETEALELIEWLQRMGVIAID